MRTFYLKFAPEIDLEGKVGHVLGISTEITERKKAEEALRASEQRWSTTLASIGDAVIATDTEARITFMNAVAQELTGWTLPEAAQKPVEEVFHIVNEQTRHKVDNPVTKVIEKGVIVGLANHTVLVRKDGTEVPIDDSGAPIRDEDGRTTGVALVFRDTTERKKAEDAMQQYSQELENHRNHLEELVKQRTGEATDLITPPDNGPGGRAAQSFTRAA